jgi:hypothetical protein
MAVEITMTSREIMEQFEAALVAYEEVTKVRRVTEPSVTSSASTTVMPTSASGARKCIRYLACTAS